MASKSKIAKAARGRPHSLQRDSRRDENFGVRAVYRKFGACRIHFRELADKGLIPGVKKASW